MSSSEQAPEPTMDEILASIRKIISDDEPEEAVQTEETARPDVTAPGPGAQQTEALSGDLADAFDSPQGSTKSSDEILDLTQVVEQQTSVEVERAREPQADFPPGPPQGDALQDALKGGGDMAAPGTPESAQASAPERNISDLLAEAGAKDAPEQAQATADASMEVPGDDSSGAAFGRSEEKIAPAVDSSMPGSEFAAMTETAPEAPAGAPEHAVEPPPSIELPDVALADAVADEEATDMMADVAAAEKAKDEREDASMTMGTPQAEEFAPKMPDLPPELPATDEETSAGPEASGAAVAAAAAAAAIDAGTESATADEQEAPDTSASADQDVKSLEDSVKEMLRPLLREWLDDNMDRIVQDAVKDEVASANLGREKN